MSETEDAKKELLEKRRKINREWYRQNRDMVNEARKKRYQDDPDYRERVKERAKTRRREYTKNKHGAVERFWKGQSILAYRIGTVAAMLNRNPKELKAWEEEGTIPQPIFGGSHRVYTQGQIDLMRELSEALRSVEPDYNQAERIKKKFAPPIKARWEKL